MLKCIVGIRGIREIDKRIRLGNIEYRRSESLVILVLNRSYNRIRTDIGRRRGRIVRRIAIQIGYVQIGRRGSQYRDGKITTRISTLYLRTYEGHRPRRFRNLEIRESARTAVISEIIIAINDARHDTIGTDGRWYFNQRIAIVKRQICTQIERNRREGWSETLTGIYLRRREKRDWRTRGMNRQYASAIASVGSILY